MPFFSISLKEILAMTNLRTESKSRKGSLHSAAMVGILSSTPVCVAVQCCFFLLALEVVNAAGPMFAIKLHTLPKLGFLATFRWTRALELGHVAASLLWVAMRFAAARLSIALKSKIAADCSPMKDTDHGQAAE
jgi:hypothetical protein